MNMTLRRIKYQIHRENPRTGEGWQIFSPNPGQTKPFREAGEDFSPFRKERI
jgi:hypothetical protein